jgi:hypothetical protein
MEQFMFAMDGNLKPVVGQQITLTSLNSATVTPRIDLLLGQAATGNCDLVVKGRVAGRVARLGARPTRRSAAIWPPRHRWPIRICAPWHQSPDRELTYSCVPPGSGTRIGIDRDEDGVLDRDDSCPSRANAGQADGDGDLIGDACDNCTVVANRTSGIRAGIATGNRCDGDLNGNVFVNAQDTTIFSQQARHERRRCGPERKWQRECPGHRLIPQPARRRAGTVGVGT